MNKIIKITFTLLLFSVGVVVQALSNPVVTSSNSYDSRVAVQWQAVDGADSYRIYYSTENFNDLSKVTTFISIPEDRTEGGVAGLINGQEYFVQVASVLANSVQNFQVTPIRLIPELDETGPLLQSIDINGEIVNSAFEVKEALVVKVKAQDPSGVSSITLSIDGTALNTHSNGESEYQAVWPLSSQSEGIKILNITAQDSLGNETTQSIELTVQAPSALPPTILVKSMQGQVNKAVWPVQINSSENTQIQITINGVDGNWLTTKYQGKVNAVLNLSAGENVISAKAKLLGSDNVIQSSYDITLTLNLNLPDQPTSVAAQALVNGQIEIQWYKNNNDIIAGYNIYRSRTVIVDKTTQSVSKLNQDLITSNQYIDLLVEDGDYYYAVEAVSHSSEISALSESATVYADNQAPFISEVKYQFLGAYNDLSYVAGIGKVNIQFELNEALQTTPYLALVPPAMAPIVLTPKQDSQNPLSYLAEFEITADMNPGVAYLVFSSLDLRGNRGTQIQEGGQFVIDTQGPKVQNFKSLLGELIDNNPDDLGLYQELNFNLDLNEKIAQGTSVTLIPHKNGEPLPGFESGVDLLAKPDDVNPNQLSWQFSLALDSDFGLDASSLPVVDKLSFLISAQDALGNITHGFIPNVLQVFQGDLPPAAVPMQLNAQAMAKGQVSLQWGLVNQASQYVLHRKIPGSDDYELIKTLSSNEFIDGLETPLSGLVSYKVASIREQLGQQTQSAFSHAVQVNAISQAPTVVQNVQAMLTEEGIVTTWQQHEQQGVSYNVYQVDGKQVTTVEGATPLAVNLQQIEITDNRLEDYNAYYIVTAVDYVGNESEPSQVAEVVTQVLPVSSLVVHRNMAGLPVLTWSYPQIEILGFNIYRHQGNEVQLITPEPTHEKQFLDEDISIEYSWLNPQQYSVKAVALDGSESASMLRTLPLYEITEVEGHLRRGLFNELYFKVANYSNTVLEGLTLELDTQSALSATLIKSAPINIPAMQYAWVNMTVPGYEDLQDETELTILTKIESNQQPLSYVEQSISASVVDDSLVARVLIEKLTKGAINTVRLEFENNSDLENQLVMAKKQGHQYASSPDIKVLVLDTSDNVLTQVAVEQLTGSLLEQDDTLLAIIAPHSKFISEPIAIPTRESWPDEIKIKVVLSQYHHAYGTSNQLSLPGAAPSKTVLLQSTQYYADQISLSGTELLANDDGASLTISGKAINRENQQTMAYVPLDVVLSINGFERRLEVVTNDQGAFITNFKPRTSETGFYQVSVIHPVSSERPIHGQFSVKGAGVYPENLNVQLARQFKKPLQVEVRAGNDTPLTNVHLALIDGQTNENLFLDLTHAIDIAPGETGVINLELSAQELGSGIQKLNVLANEYDTALGVVSINYVATYAEPSLLPSPSFVESGVTLENIVTDKITLTNKGLSDLLNAQVLLQIKQGASWVQAPAWLSLLGPADVSRLAIGQALDFNIQSSPLADTQVGDYEIRLQIIGDNMAAFHVPMYLKLTTNTKGAVQFHISDNFTGTESDQGVLIPGLQNAKIEIQNPKVLSDTFEAASDNQGYASFSDLPVGEYVYRVTAFDHQEVTGRILIRADVTSSANILIPIQTVAVSFDVSETQIRDEYTLSSQVKFETDVPAAVVVFEQTTFMLPDMKKGEEYLDKLVIVNKGLLNAYGIKGDLPQSNNLSRFEFFGDIPTSLKPGEVVVIPFKVTALKDFDEINESDASGAASERLLTVSDIRLSGFYECNSGVVVFWSPVCSFRTSYKVKDILPVNHCGPMGCVTMTAPVVNGSVTVHYGNESVTIRPRGPSTVYRHPNGRVTIRNSYSSPSNRNGYSSSVTVTLSEASSSSRPSRPRPSRPRPGRPSNSGNGNSGNGNSGNGNSGNGNSGTNHWNTSPDTATSRQPGYRIKMGRSTLSGCRQLTSSNISRIIQGASNPCK